MVSHRSQLQWNSEFFVCLSVSPFLSLFPFLSLPFFLPLHISSACFPDLGSHCLVLIVAFRLFFSICSYSNYTVRSLPIPSHDVSKVVGKEGVDDALAKIQRCISRNHSNERFEIELADRHKRRLLTAAQQSVSPTSRNGLFYSTAQTTYSACT